MERQDIDPHREYIDAWKARRRLEEETLKRRREEALRDARRIADLLVQGYGIRKVVLFGSLSRGEFREDSDIDLAVGGLEKAKYFQALAEAGRLTDIPVELRLLEECQGLLQERISKEGLVLYEG